MSTFEDALEHFGIKGMKWGVRRRRGSDGRVKGGSSSKTKYKKSPSRLSDADLNKRVKRLEMEKKYNELNATQQSEGRKMATRIVKSVGESAVTRVATDVSVYAGKQLVKKAISKKSGADKAANVYKEIFPKKK